MMFNTKIALLTLGLTLSSTIPAFAESDVTSTNATTGSNSTNSVTTSVENSTTVNNSNSSEVTNTISIQANTGGNSASDNTGDANIQTGNITGNVTVVNEGNVNSVAANNSNSTNVNTNGNVNINVSNTNTGSNSENVVETNFSNSREVNNTNTARVNNNVNLDLNTGGNRANNNTGDASITTGSIDFNTEVVNCLNFNLVGTNQKPNCPIEVAKGAPKEEELVPFVEEAEPVTPNVLVAAANPVPVEREGEVLGATALPATGTEVNFRFIMLATLVLTLSGMMLRQKAKAHLALLDTRLVRRAYARNAI